MPHQLEVTGCGPHSTDDSKTVKPAPPALYTIKEFCEAHRISVSMFYKMRGEGLAPDEMKVGARRLISFESAARWRAKREARDTAAVGSE